MRFLTRYDGEVSEPLVGRQGCRVSMQVARGSASLLPSHGRPGKHTELYIGTKRLIGARGNAYGPGPEHGKPGDQGGEIVKTAYYNFPWTICLRFEGLPKNKRVQAGSFEKKANAEALEKEIKARTGLPMTTTRIDGWYTVRTKSMDVDEAEEAFRKLKSAGFDAIIV